MREYVKKVKEWYELGLWSERHVRDAVEKGKLSANEYVEVTGKVY